MPRRVRSRLTVCLAAAATTAIGVVLAPAASANPVQDGTVLDHLRSTKSNAPNVLPNVPPFGRKLV